MFFINTVTITLAFVQYLMNTNNDFDMVNFRQHLRNNIASWQNTSKIQYEIPPPPAELPPKPVLIEEKPIIKHNSTDNMCKICFSNQVNAMFTSCKHIGCCYGCAKNIQVRTGLCPFCRCKTSKVIQIYMM